MYVLGELPNFRAKIENALRILSERHDLDQFSSKLGNNIRALAKKGIFTETDVTILNDLVEPLNCAAHGESRGLLNWCTKSLTKYEDITKVSRIPASEPIVYKFTHSTTAELKSTLELMKSFPISSIPGMIPITLGDVGLKTVESDILFFGLGQYYNALFIMFKHGLDIVEGKII